MTYLRFFKICRIVGIISGCISGFHLSPPSAHQLNTTKIQLTRFFLLVYSIFLAFTVNFLSVDYLFQYDPSIRGSSYLILVKGKDVAFCCSGSILLISTLILRKRLIFFMDKVFQSTKERGPFLSTGSRILIKSSIIISLLHCIYLLGSDTFNLIVMDNAWLEANRNIRRYFFTFENDSVYWFYSLKCLFTIYDLINVLGQNFVLLFMSVGACFISDLHRKIVLRLELSMKSTSFLKTSPGCVEKKVESLMNSMGNDLIAMEILWKELVEIYEAFNSLCGAFLLIIFPFSTIILVARIGRLTFGFLSTSGSGLTKKNFVYAFIYLMKVLIIVEIGHHFKAKVCKCNI
jgi:hypothetical protein